jgi:uncharacterized protein (UPF0276 family)
MLLALNYSQPAADLVSSGYIKIDLFKTPDWQWMVDEARLLRPVAVHYTLEAGNNELDQVDWNMVEHLARTTNTPYINIHLDAKQRTFPWLSVDTTDIKDLDYVYKIILSDVMTLVERFGQDRIIIENSPYHGDMGNTLRLCVEPGLITRIIEETGCGLLLDISHAIITSINIGMDPFEYFSSLPVHKVNELHFAGIHRINGRWTDHLSILKRDWRWLDWVLTRLRTGEWSTPWMLAFEYGGVGAGFEWRSKSDVILDQVPKLLERVKSADL